MKKPILFLAIGLLVVAFGAYLKITKTSYATLVLGIGLTIEFIGIVGFYNHFKKQKA